MTNIIPWFDIDNLIFVGDDYTLFKLETEVKVLYNNNIINVKTDPKELSNSINSVRYPYLVEVYKLS